MTFSVEISPQAEKDLREIYEYIFFKLSSPKNAENQLARLEKAIYSLNQMPERFHRYDKEPWLSRGLRFLTVDNYSIFYITDEIENTVSIVRVMYGKRNIAEQLKNI